MFETLYFYINKAIFTKCATLQERIRQISTNDEIFVAAVFNKCGADGDISFLIYSNSVL